MSSAPRGDLYAPGTSCVMSVFASLGDLPTGQSNSQVIMGALCHDLQEGLETNGQLHGHQ